MSLFLFLTALADRVTHCQVFLFGADGEAPRNAAAYGNAGRDWCGEDDGFLAFFHLEDEWAEKVFVADDGSVVRALYAREAGLQIWRSQEPLTAGLCYDLRVRLPDGELLGGLVEPVCITDHVDTRPPRLGPIRDARWFSATVDYGVAWGGPPLLVDHVWLALGFDETSGGTRDVALYTVREDGPARTHWPWRVQATHVREGLRYVGVDTVAGWPLLRGDIFRVGETEYLRVDPYDLAGNRGPSVYLEATWTGDATTSTVRRVSARRARRWGQ